MSYVARRFINAPLLNYTLRRYHLYLRDIYTQCVLHSPPLQSIIQLEKVEFIRGDHMSIIKNAIPILEFDTEQTAVINPTHENLDLKLPKKCVFAFLGAHIDAYASQTDTKQVSIFVSATKHYPIYVTKYKGEEIALCQAPVGAAATTQLLDWLIGYGVREIVSAGSCGALEKFPESTFLVPSKALRDEGTSYHYAPPSRFMEISERARKAIAETILEHGMKYQEITTWSTDGFFRETKEKVAYRKREGCSVVEMECSALAACAALRDVTWGMILYTADSLADVEKYDMRNWGGNAYEYALTLCLDSVLKL